MLFLIASALILYALVAYLRRKKVTPNYQGKTVWITGGSSGLGEFLAYEFNRHGADLIISARNKKELERVQSNCPFPNQVQVVQLDMTNYSQIDSVSHQIIKNLQKNNKQIDVLVENAGISMRCQFLDYPFENHEALFNVNVHGPYRHLQAVIPHMVKHKQGQVVGISSLAGKLATAYRTSYAGSKHAFIGILDSLRTELTPFNIKVCNLMPGYIKTNISKNAMGAVAGQKFGQTDKNIETGMEPDLFAKEAVGAIYNLENEVSIGDQWSPVVGLVLRNLCPDLFFRLMLWNSKNQSKAVKEAKKQ